MTEVIGAVASVAQLVQLSGALLAGGYGFLAKAVRAPAEIRSLLTETAAINSLLGQLQDVADSTPDDALQTLERTGAFEECTATLKSIEKALAKCENLYGQDVKNLGKRLLWPFKEKETNDALQRLHRLRGLLANAVGINSALALKRIELKQESLAETVSHLSAAAEIQMDTAEDERIISWICPLLSDGAFASLDNALNRRLPGTGTWFLESDMYKQWISSNSPSGIWITGLPGSGKTILCSSIIEHVRQAASPDTPVMFFFCDHRDSQKQTLENFLMSILKQLLAVAPAALQQVKTIYKANYQISDRPFNRDDYAPLVRELLHDLEEYFLILDGLDESSEGESIADFLENIFTNAEGRGDRFHMIFSSRFDIGLEKRQNRIVSTRFPLGDNTRPDIERYIHSEIAYRLEKGKIKVRDRALLPAIEQCVSAKAGTILQARLQLDYLSTAKTDRTLKSMLLNMPNGLEYTYESLLQIAKTRFPDRLNDIRKLLWSLCVAVSPLSAFQLAEVLALHPEDTYLDLDSITTDPYDALETIAPLVVIDREGLDYETVKLCHFSLQEYLCSNQLRNSGHEFYVDQREAHSWLAFLSLHYLTVSPNTDLDNMDAKPNGPNFAKTHHFLPYAALYWYYHMADASGYPGHLNRIRPYLDSFVNGDSEFTSWFSRAQEIFRNHFPHHDAGLHSFVCFAVYADLGEILDYILSRVTDLNHQFPDGYTLLTAAARWDCPLTIHKLLGLGASIDVPTRGRGLTPLHIAAEFGCKDSFDILLQAGANPHARSTSLTTPFYRAARGGDVHILTELKKRGCDVNARTYDNWTPLHEAVSMGNTQAVDLLLSWGADPTATTDDGYMAEEMLIN